MQWIVRNTNSNLSRLEDENKLGNNQKKWQQFLPPPYAILHVDDEDRW
jgi:hypothetical protein